MLSSLSQAIERVLLRKIADRFQVEYSKLNFTIPPKIELGELASPAAFDLARKVKKPPREIARQLAEDAQSIPGVWKVDVAGGGYLNFHFDRAALTRGLAESISRNEFGRLSSPEAAGKVIVEHTNINPNKAAHIGHLRNAALGDTFVRCLRFLGYRVEVQNYLDNTGVQVADVVVGFEKMEGKSLAEVAALEGRFDYYCWDVYARVADFYNQAGENKAHRSRTLQLIEAGDNPTAELAQHVAMRVVKAHLATMKRINVHYDLLPRESEILHLHFWEKAFQLLKERSAIYHVTEGKNLGCWVMNTAERAEDLAGGSREEAEDDEKIIVRSDGTVTYVGKDIAYQLWKFGLLGLDFKYALFDSGDGPLWVTTTRETAGVEAPSFGGGQRVYNVIDSRQAYLQSVVLQGLEALGFMEQARNSIHFSYEMVALSPATCEELGFRLSEEEKKRSFVEVSGRKGLGVKADDLIDTLVARAMIEVRARHTIPEDEAAQIAGTIAVAALRYFLERFARNTLIAFDFKEALSFEGETGPYVQYAVVRAANILREYGAAGGSLRFEAADIDEAGLRAFLLDNEDIWELIFLAARLPEVVRQVAQSLEIAQLAKYAFSLARGFNHFYHTHHILREPDESRKQLLLFVLEIIRRQLAKTLDLLGCGVPPRM